mmetsp:Transcript_20351/g.56405  ORF Transcript_20351/g.56405 Transcript_20351/m.56405 type:complete len:247 (-) Transcript_20351:596-1336(-)
MFVHIMGALQKPLHCLKPILQGQGQHANCRANRVPAADPVPESKRVVRVNPKFLHELDVGRHSNHVLRHCILILKLGDQPLADSACVKHSLRGCEGLGNHNNQCGLSIKAIQGAGHIDGVNVRQEPERPAAAHIGGTLIRSQSSVNKQGSEEAPADSNGNHCRQGLARDTNPLAVANLVREVLDLVKHLPHVWNNILSICHDRLAPLGAEGNVQHRPVLRGVDAVSVPHGIDFPTKICFICQLEQL